MSNALSRLRQYFDDELLVPVGGKLELTPRAEVLHEAVKDVLLRIGEIIRSHGAEIAFPTQTLHLAATAESAGADVPPTA
jgi:DNA-binding transcriptional LysR family regulator